MLSLDQCEYKATQTNNLAINFYCHLRALVQPSKVCHTSNSSDTLQSSQDIPCFSKILTETFPFCSINSSRLVRKSEKYLLNIWEKSNNLNAESKLNEIEYKEFKIQKNFSVRNSVSKIYVCAMFVKSPFHWFSNNRPKQGNMGITIWDNPKRLKTQLVEEKIYYIL